MLFSCQHLSHNLKLSVSRRLRAPELKSATEWRRKRWTPSPRRQEPPACSESPCRNAPGRPVEPLLRKTVTKTACLKMSSRFMYRFRSEIFTFMNIINTFKGLGYISNLDHPPWLEERGFFNGFLSQRKRTNTMRILHLQHWDQKHED